MRPLARSAESSHVIAWLAMLFATAVPVAAQSPAPSVARCSALMDSVVRAAPPGPPDFRAVKQVVRPCVDRLSVDSVAPDDLVALAALLRRMGDDRRAGDVIDRRLADPTLALPARLEALRTALDIYGNTDATLVRTREIADRIDALGDAAVADRLRAHVALMRAANAVGRSSVERDESRKVLDVAARPIVRDSLIDERTSAVSDAAAYLADVLASDDDGSRVPVVIGAIRHRFPDLPALGPLLETTEQRYALIGETAPPLRADEWLGDSLPIAGRGGKVRVLEFTAHWCAACHLSYPTLVAIARRHASDVDVVLATQTYGYFGRDTAVAFDDEVARDRMLYARELPIRSGIAVERRPAGAGDDWQGANARAYGVKALPVLVVTDRSGIVRDIWFGWTEASAARLQRDVTRAMGTSVSSQ